MTGSLKRAGAEGQVRTAVIADAVHRVLARRFDEAGSRFRVKRFKNGTAVVTCERATLAEDIRLAEPELVEEANSMLGAEIVKKIVTGM